MKKIKILIISDPPWNNNNNNGNTFSNLFQNMENVEIGFIYLRPGLPVNNMKNVRYFQITDKDLVNNLKNKKFPVGIEVEKVDFDNSPLGNKVKFAQKKRWLILYLARELLWKIGRWKSKELIDFIDDFKPDIIYCHIFFFVFFNNFIYFIKKHLNVPMIGHFTDDYYSYKNYGIDIFSYIHKYFLRKSIYKLVKQCEFVDTFTNIQKKEYEKIFNVPFKIRYKSANIEEIKKEYNNPLVFLYTGNLGNKRWKNLVEIGRTLDKININDKKAILKIYSGTPLTKKMEYAFNNCQSLNFIGSVSGEEVQKLQSEADVLIHTESFDKLEIQNVRMSLSTKIIDYLSKGKCILAFGPKEVASIDYIIKNDCGLVIDDENDLYDKIKSIIENKELIYDYSIKSLEIAKKNHNLEKLHKEFYEDLLNIVKI